MHSGRTLEHVAVVPLSYMQTKSGESSENLRLRLRDVELGLEGMRGVL